MQLPTQTQESLSSHTSSAELVKTKTERQMSANNQAHPEDQVVKTATNLINDDEWSPTNFIMELSQSILKTQQLQNSPLFRETPYSLSLRNLAETHSPPHLHKLL